MTIENCSVNNNSSISANSLSSILGSAYLGRLVGEIDGETLINVSSNKSSLNPNNYGDSSSPTTVYVGGQVGKSSSSGNVLPIIRDSYNQGIVYVSSDSFWPDFYIGGIAGLSNSTINRCYNSEDIKTSISTMTSCFISGITGKTNIPSAVIENSAVMPNIISNTKNSSNISIISNNRSSQNVNNIGNKNMSKFLINDAKALLSIEELYLKETYEDIGWDFNNIWKLSSSEFPTHKLIQEDISNNINKVNEVISNLNIQYAPNDHSGRVTVNMIFNLKNEKNVIVTWNSSNSEIVTNTGIISRDSSDNMIIITATAKKGEYTVEKRFLINVVGVYNTESVISKEWAFSVEDAKTLLSIIRKVKYKDISNDDPDFLVLIGDINDIEKVKKTMAKIVTFWDVMESSPIIERNLGDVYKLIEKGQDVEYNA